MRRELTLTINRRKGVNVSRGMAAVAVAVCLLVFGAARMASLAAVDDDILAKSKAVYAGLKTYADTGSIDLEFGPAASPLHEHHTFKTFYRAPRHFYFDFVKEKGIDRLVVWSDDQAFHTKWMR